MAAASNTLGRCSILNACQTGGLSKFALLMLLCSRSLSLGKEATGAERCRWREDHKRLHR